MFSARKRVDQNRNQGTDAHTRPFFVSRPHPLRPAPFRSARISYFSLFFLNFYSHLSHSMYFLISPHSSVNSSRCEKRSKRDKRKQMAMIKIKRFLYEIKNNFLGFSLIKKLDEFLRFHLINVCFIRVTS